MDTVDSVVIGAGVIGLAVARRLALAGQDVIVLEAEPAIGTHSSSRNSEVIHAGIYYPADSLKAQFCVSGKRQLYAYCQARDIAHRRVGKLIVAVRDDEREVLERYQQQAAGNGVDDLEWLDAAAVRRLEPRLSCVAALLSPSTGIIDSHEYMLSLQADLESGQGTVLTHCPVRRVEIRDGGFVVHAGEAQGHRLYTRRLINAAGLAASRVAGRIEGLAPGHVPEQRFARGHYYTLAGPPPCSRLVYPVANEAGLGIHLTLDLAGQGRFGPDVHWLDQVDYAFDDSRRDDFVTAIRRYFPALDPAALSPGYTGIRPKLSGPGEPAADFRLQGPDEHGIEGLVNLFGIESPGLTSSLAIADSVANILQVSVKKVSENC